MPPVEIHNLGKFGVISDLSSHQLPPEAWSDARNVRFNKRGAQRMSGHSQVFDTLSATPEFICNIIGDDEQFWVYFSLAAAWAYDGSHTDITRTVGGAYTGTVGRSWNCTILGGVPIFNNGVDLPQYWPTIATGTPLANLPDFEGPSAVSLRAKVLRAFGPYLVALNVTENGIRFPQTLQWSHKTDPGSIPSSWDYTDPAVDAGRIQLTDVKGGDILDAQLLGDELIIYKEYSTHALRLVGGNEIFAPRLLLSTSGLFAPRCATPFKDGTRHFCVTSDDIIIHAGTKETRSIAKDRVQNQIFNEIDPVDFGNSHVFENRLTKECWFAYPTNGNEYPNRAAIWNYDDDTWTFRDFTGVSTDVGSLTEVSLLWNAETNIWDTVESTWSTESRAKVIFVDRVKAFLLDSTFQFDGVNPTVFMERTGLSIDGKDREGKPRASLITRKLAHRIWPKITGENTISVTLGKQELLGGVVEYDNTQQFDPSTQKFLDSTATPVNGLLIAVRYEATSDTTWILEGHDLYVERLGEL